MAVSAIGRLLLDLGRLAIIARTVHLPPLSIRTRIALPHEIINSSLDYQGNDRTCLHSKNGYVLTDLLCWIHLAQGSLKRYEMICITP